MYLTIQHIQFITHTQSQSQYYNPKATCYHTSQIIYTSHNINIYMAQTQTLPVNYAIHITTQSFSKSF